MAVAIPLPDNRRGTESRTSRQRRNAAADRNLCASFARSYRATGTRVDHRGTCRGRRARAPAIEVRVIRLIRELVRPYRWSLALIFSAMIVETLMSLAGPWPLKVILDNVVGGSHLPAW